jgi:ribosomal protein S18 acetylase RimI-like enzyme
MDIVSLKPEQKKRAAQVVANAFFNYPSLIYYFPDIKRRTHWLPWYMERVLNSAITFGEVLVTEDVSGVLFFLPPSRTRLSDWDFVKCGFLASPLVVGLRRYPYVNECEQYLADTQEKLLTGRPHYYLWGLAVDPFRQRTGSGKALLEVFMKKADLEHLPVYLETHRFENVAYYEKQGFKLIHTDAVPKHELEFWCLLREPGGA